MALVNRDKDASEQKDIYAVKLGALATGVTASMFVVPYPSLLQNMRSASKGLSGSPQLAFLCTRFIPGAGGTAIPISISNMVLNNLGTSGVMGYSGLVATGSTLLNLQAGDILEAVTSGSNAATADLVLTVVLKKLQDVVSCFGVSS